jgi:ArsR family metal-binding transcriptional regulator
LTIEALDYTNCQLDGKNKTELVARNYLPPSNCIKCGKQATYICTFCTDEEGRPVLVCDECAQKEHNEENEEEEHYLLPLANSPRSGVCGYEPPGPLDELF